MTFGSCGAWSMDEKSSSNRVFSIAVLAACLNGVAVGNLAGWPQAAIPRLLSPSSTRVAFTESQTSWIAGIFFVGMLIGGFTSLVVAGRFGKRRLFLLATVPLVLGWTMIALATSFWEFIVSRIFLGIGGGLMFNQTEMFLSEVSPARLRSHMSIVFCACVHVGILMSFGIGPSLTLSSATGFYLTVVLLLASCYLTIVPETPFWLLRQGRSDEALESLRKLRGKPDVHKEFEDIVEFVENGIVTSQSEGIFANLKRVLSYGANRKAILLVVLLTTAQQFSGMAGMMTYAQLIFERSVTAIPARHVTLLLGLIEFICTIGSSCVIERVGRRPLVTISSTICATCMAVMGLYFHGVFGEGYEALPVVCIVIFAVSYGTGLSTMSTVVAAESLSMDARNLGAAVQNTTVCTFIFLIMKLWQVIATSYGQEYSFWMASVITIGHTIVLLIILPETRGKSLTEIQLLLSSSKDKSATLLPDMKSIKIVSTSQELRRKGSLV